MVATRRTGNQFGIEVGQWTRSMKDYTKAVFHESVLELISIMQTPVQQGGRMPVDTGFLRASLEVGTTPVENLSWMHPGHSQGQFSWSIAEVERTVRSAKVGDIVYMVYQSETADWLEFGTSENRAYGFQRGAVQQWPSIVRRVARSLEKQP